MPKKPSTIRSLALQIAADAAKDRSDHPVRQMVARQGYLTMPLAIIRPNPTNPRKEFEAEPLKDLAASIAEKGVLQPILVRKDPDHEGYIIIAGERRWRAAQVAGLDEIPALIRPGDDALEVALIENLQRENLSPIEEAEALLELKTQRGYTDADLARVIGKSRKAVNDTLLLNQLPEAIKAEWRTSAIGSKSQILQVLRAGSPEKVRTAWDALKRGEVRTVRDLRKHKAAAQKRGRPPHYRFEFTPTDHRFHVTVAFKKARATRGEVCSALKVALKDASQHG